jgi:hypothetical protein
MMAYEMLLCKASSSPDVRPPSQIFVKPPPFPAEIREQLLDSYKEDILRLQDLVGGYLSPCLEGAGVNAGGGR